MKILVIRETNPWANSNATNNRFLSLTNGLVENGCNIDLLFLSGYYQNIEKINFKKTGCINKINYKYLLPVNYSNFFIRQFFYRIFPNIFSEKKIKGYLRKNEFDFVWLDFGPKVVQIGLNLFKKKLNIKYFHERSEFSWIGLSNRNRLHEKYLKYFLPKIDVMSIMTKSLIDYYKDYISKKTKIVHLPITVDFSRFQNKANDNQLNKPYIAYCGTMNDAKDGVDILIQSFIKIMCRFPNLSLYLAGPLSPERDYILQKAIISKGKAENKITYLGSLSKEEIPTFLLNASVLALARPTSKQAEGGFPTKLGEYLATGKPVCITNVGEIGNYLKDNESAFIANPGSVDSFADAFRRALTSSNAGLVGKNGKRIALINFNKDIQAKVLYDLLTQNL